MFLLGALPAVNKPRPRSAERAGEKRPLCGQARRAAPGNARRISP